MTQQGRDVLEVVNRLVEKGVALWVEDGKICYRVAKGFVTRAELDALRAARDQIVRLMTVDNAGLGDAYYGMRTEEIREAPLSFSQLSHWRLYNLEQRAGTRQIASATQLLGHLNIDALSKAIAEVVRRHESLRARIVARAKGPVQVIERSVDWRIGISDLSRQSSRLRSGGVQSSMRRLLSRPVEISKAPLFEIELLRLADEEHVLLIVMEHIISDAFSMNVLVRDIFAAYETIVIGKKAEFAASPLQFSDYVLWQKARHRSWLEVHEPYLAKHLQGCDRLRFPRDDFLSSDEARGWATVPVKIDRNLRSRLEQWCRLHGTTLVMGVFAAYIALVLRWCNAVDTVVQFQSDGRFWPHVENSVGYFATVLYIRVRLAPDETFVDLVKHVTEEYCRAYAHADFCYLESRVPRPDFTRNTCFNWLHGEKGISVADGRDSGGTLVGSPVPFEFPAEIIRRDNEPMIVLGDVRAEIVGDVMFPAGLFKAESMERFARSFLMILATVVSNGSRCVADLPLLVS